MGRISTTIVAVYAVVLASMALITSLPAYGQVPVDDSGEPIVSLDNADSEYTTESYESESEPLTPAELETLVGPIALYPDDLLAIVLPASTYPLQVVQAARFLEAYEIDSSLEPDESWDESVVALINYPEVVQLLNDDIDWTWRLGEAVIGQQQDVISAVESFRDRAYAAGNLKSDEHQTVTRASDVIEIDPIEEDIIYVPYYEPERVVIRQPYPVYYYYDRPRPVYYYPYPTGYSFSSGYFWGVTTAFQIGWASNYLHVYHPSYWGHPYYGRSYLGQNYRSSSISLHNTFYVNNTRRYASQHLRNGDYWRPRRHVGARQSDYYAHTRQYRSDGNRRRHGDHRNGTRPNDRRRSDTDTTSARSQNGIRFRQRDGNDSVRTRRDRRDRSDATRSQIRPQATRLARSSESNRDRHQVRRAPPQRVANNETSRQRPQQFAGNEQNRSRRQQGNNEQNRPRRQQAARVEQSPAQPSGGHRQTPTRQVRTDAHRQRNDGSQRRQRPVKQGREPAHNTEHKPRSTHTNGEHSRKSERGEKRSLGGDRKERTSGRRERRTRASQ